MSLSRREFLAAAAVSPQLMKGAGKTTPVVCIFSKHLAKLDYDQLGKTSRELGFDGVDLTVRKKSHVLPEKAAADLPRAVEAVRAHGLAVPMVTTELTSAAHPTARPILSTASRLKVPYFKPGYWLYRDHRVIPTLEEARQGMRGLTELGKEFGIEAGFHNHSGPYVGEAVWDIRELIKDLDPRWVGYYFDPGHATVEGGLAGWQVSLDLVLPQLKMVALKDFYWEKKNGKWDVRWCPMGEGMVNWAKVFGAFAAAKFTGPMSLHVEYDSADELAAISHDVEFIKKQVAQAYGA